MLPNTRVRLATVAARYSWNFGLDLTEVAGLPDAQLDQPRQSVLHYHPSRSILVVVGALLQGPGLLQHAFLGMDQHPSTLPALGRDALGAQWTYPTYRPVELESLQSIDTTGAICPLSRWHDGAGTCPAGQVQLPAARSR